MLSNTSWISSLSLQKVLTSTRSLIDTRQLLLLLLLLGGYLFGDDRVAALDALQEAALEAREALAAGGVGHRHQRLDQRARPQRLPAGHVHRQRQTLGLVARAPFHHLLLRGPRRPTKNKRSSVKCPIFVSWPPSFAFRSSQCNRFE